MNASLRRSSTISSGRSGSTRASSSSTLGALEMSSSPESLTSTVPPRCSLVTSKVFTGQWRRGRAAIALKCMKTAGENATAGAGARRRTERSSSSALRGRGLLDARLVRALLGRLGLRELPVDVVPVDVAEERLDVLAPAVGRRAEVAHVGVLVHVERQHRDHVVDGPQVLGVADVVEDRPVVQVVADPDPAAGGLRGLADRLLPHVDAARVLVVEQLGEAAVRLVAVAAQVA